MYGQIFMARYSFEQNKILCSLFVINYSMVYKYMNKLAGLNVEFYHTN